MPRSNRPRPSVRPTVKMPAVRPPKAPDVDECPVCKGRGVVPAEVADAIESTLRDAEERK